LDFLHDTSLFELIIAGIHHNFEKEIAGASQSLVFKVFSIVFAVDLHDKMGEIACEAVHL